MPAEFPSARGTLESLTENSQPVGYGRTGITAVAPDPVNNNEVGGLDALELAPAEEKGGRGRRVWASAWPKLIAIAIVLLIWEMTALSGWKPSYILPGPGPVLKELGSLVKTADFWDGVRLTMTRALFGFALAFVIGTVLGSLVATFAPLRAAIGSLITGLQTMPSVLWFPLAILLFQLNESAIYFVVILGAAPSIANGLISGIDYVPPTWLRVGQVMGMRGWSKYRHLILPASLPSFVSGLKQGWAFSWRSLMAGELLVIVPGTVSIGVRIQNAQDLFDTKSVIAYIIVVLILGILIDILFTSADSSLRKRWGLKKA
jgi:NitT/TauT family transport system permease protein